MTRARNGIRDGGLSVIYHIVRKNDWDSALAAGSYAARSLGFEGFMHCSTAEQVLSTANRLFKGQTDLVLLCIETDSVEAEIRYENLENGTSLFPHIYGALPIDAVRAVHDFPPRDDGSFELPPEIK